MEERMDCNGNHQLSQLTIAGGPTICEFFVDSFGNEVQRINQFHSGKNVSMSLSVPSLEVHSSSSLNPSSIMFTSTPNPRDEEWFCCEPSTSGINMFETTGDLCPQETYDNVNYGYCDDARLDYPEDRVHEVFSPMSDVVPTPDNTLLDALKKALERLSVSELKYEIMPVVMDRYQDPEVATRRGIAQILGKLVSRLQLEDAKFDLVPVVQALCQDADSSVRTVITKELSTFAFILSFTSFKSTLLPHLIDLCRDEDCKVRIAALEAVLNSIEHMDERTCGRLIVPLVQGFFEDAMKRYDLSLVSVAQHIGRLCHSLRDSLSPSDKRWFLDYYAKIIRLDHSSSCLQDDLLNSNISDLRSIAPQYSIAERCRKWCAYNLPAMVHISKSIENFSSSLWLTPIIKSLSQDSSSAVRLHLANGFHEICSLMPDQVTLLTDCFMELLQSESPEIVEAAIGNVDKVLCFIQNSRSIPAASIASVDRDCNGNQLTGDDVSLKCMKQVCDKLKMCNGLLKDLPSWRPHELYLSQLAHLVKYLSGEAIYQDFVPALQREIVTVRPLPCRHAAIRSLLKFVLYIKKRAQRCAVVEMLVSDVGQHKSCHKRQLFLDSCSIAMELFSKGFVNQHFLIAALKLHSDNVASIRLKLCKLLPKLKALITLPQDQEKLNVLESVVKDMLKQEKNRNVLEMLQNVILELDCPQKHCISDAENAQREKEEYALFSREESEKQRARVSPLRCSIPSPSSRKGSQLKTTQPQGPRFVPLSTNEKEAFESSAVPRSRPRTAIVRPQRINKRPPSPRPPPAPSKAELPDSGKRGPSLQKSGSNSGIPSLKAASSSSSPSPSSSVKPSTTAAQLLSPLPPTGNKARSDENLHRISNAAKTAIQTIPRRMSSSASGLPPVPSRTPRMIQGQNLLEPIKITPVKNSKQPGVSSVGSNIQYSATVGRLTSRRTKSDDRLEHLIHPSTKGRPPAAISVTTRSSTHNSSVGRDSNNRSNSGTSNGSIGATSITTTSGSFSRSLTSPRRISFINKESTPPPRIIKAGTPPTITTFSSVTSSPLITRRFSGVLSDVFNNNSNRTSSTVSEVCAEKSITVTTKRPSLPSGIPRIGSISSVRS